MVIDEYLAYCDKYVALYGANTFIAYQCGDFFEAYAFPDGDGRPPRGADIHAIADICNWQVTRKNKSILECTRSNPWMAGVPMHAFQKHAATLVQHGYTVVVVRQLTPPPNVTRDVTEILSPATLAQAATTANGDGTYLLTLFCDREGIGIAGVDLTTGHTFAHEVAHRTNDPNFVTDEVHRIATRFQPKEIAVYGTQPFDAIAAVLNASTTASVHYAWNADPSQTTAFQKPAFQNAILARAYPTQTSAMLSPLEIAGIERFDQVRTAFALMLQFAYDHNDRIIERLMLPEILSVTATLTLEYNSAIQLNVLSHAPTDKPLLHLLNRCVTACGRRLFRERLLAPLTDVAAIQQRYDAVAHLIATQTFEDIRKTLAPVLDLERISRRIANGTMPPSDWQGLHQSLEAAIALGCTTAHAVCAAYTAVLDIDAAARYGLGDISGNIFVHGHVPEADALAALIDAAMSNLQTLADGLGCRVDCNDRDGYFLLTTKKRWDNNKSNKATQYITKPISASSTCLRVTSPEIDRLSTQILQHRRNLAALMNTAYTEFLATFAASTLTDLQSVAAHLANLDVTATNAKNAVDFGYVRPVASGANAAFMRAKGLRHPIIERLHDAVDYVPNDFEIGHGTAATGVLLYGLNASGKSSLMKAVGLNVIMAQAGMYVAATAMEYAPYTHIFTRISGNDNIYRGLSSFTVEMTELRNILQRCDANSLVLGDELCAGTEAISATAIVAAGIEHLAHRAASFVFATHLHELAQLPCIAERTDLYIGHLSVDVDPVTNAIVYDRRLKQGSGSPLYGLEVCRGLGMPEAFMATAHAVRRHIQAVDAHLVDPRRTSRYNQGVYVTMCAVCGTAPATETHHIRYQKDATATGFVDNGVGVHRASNLAPLCEACHLKEHRGEIRIQGYRTSTDGRTLDVVTTAPPAAHSANAAATNATRTLADHFRYTCPEGWWHRTSPRAAWKPCTEKKLRNHKLFTPNMCIDALKTNLSNKDRES